jgi:hypothetical protein
MTTIATPPKITAKQRQLQALELRLAGHTYADIAGKLGYATHSGASNAIYRALAELTALCTATANDLRTAEAERIQREIKALNKIRTAALDRHNEYPEEPRWLSIAMNTSDRIITASGLIIKLYNLDQITAAPDARPAITIISAIPPTLDDATAV